MSFADIKERTLILFNKLVISSQNVFNLNESCKKNIILRNHCQEDRSNRLKTSREKLYPYLKKIERSQMKCAFFGQTSNGKSTFINAFLGCKSLPTGNGRTTSCFVTIEGCEGDSSYFIFDGVRYDDIKKLSNMANHIRQGHLSCESCIQLFYPSNECKLLKENVILLDSPGVAFSVDNDRLIEKYCLDSDVFVYVVNGTGAINELERQFFRKVIDFIKNPKIFVVINKWDLCHNSRNPNIIEEKNQHLETVAEFFHDDLNLERNAEEWTSFLSATEQIENCRKEQSNDELVAARSIEFDNFIKKLCIEMSNNAIINKFGPLLLCADECVQTLLEILNQFRYSETRKCKESMVNIDRYDLQAEIIKLIKEIFCEITEEGTKLIKQLCNRFDITISGIEKDKCQRILENIMESLNQLFIYHMQKLILRMKDIFLSYSEFKLDDNILDNYLPLSLKELVESFNKVLSLNINKGDKEFQTKYTATKCEMKSHSERTDIIKTFRTFSTLVAVPLMFKTPAFGFLIALFSTLISNLNERFVDQRTIFLKEDYIKRIEDFYINLMSDSFKISEEEIENEVISYVNNFCDDHEQARQLLLDIDMERSKCENISVDDIQKERIKITSLSG